jgi:hypothetical protein|eukprot:COSAG06_NODE_16129_length_1020_cov_1.952226_2_plen_215_part_00
MRGGAIGNVEDGQAPDESDAMAKRLLMRRNRSPVQRLRVGILVVLVGLAIASAAAATQSTANETQADVQTYCIACAAVVQAMGADGCKAACSALPAPASEICAWMVGYLSMCADIENWLKQGLSDEDICTHLGYCGSDCQCGVCVQAVAGPDGRCLGFPNDCGHNASSALPPALFSDAPGERQVARPSELQSPQVCFDGQCGDPNSIGCCLTCF